MSKRNPPGHRRCPPTPETRAKISAALRGREHDWERKIKMISAKREYFASEKGQQLSKKASMRQKAYFAGPEGLLRRKKMSEKIKAYHARRR